MTTRSALIRWTAVVAMVGALVVAGSSAADAAGDKPKPATSGAPRGLLAAKTAVNVRINLRLATLAALKIAVNGATDLTGSDKSTLSGLVSSDATNLTALKTKTGAETTLAGVKADAVSMIDDYRIYLLVVPKVHFTIASDAETVDIAKLRTAHDKLATIASTLAKAGKDVSSEQAELADMASRLSAATSALSGKAEGLLAVAPSPDADAMKAAVAPVRTAVHDGRSDIKTAVADAAKASAGLKALTPSS